MSVTPRPASNSFMRFTFGVSGRTAGIGGRRIDPERAAVGGISRTSKTRSPWD